MKIKTLKQYVKEHSQTKAGALLGITQGAVRQTLLAGHDVRLVFDDDGELSYAYRVAPFPNPNKAGAKAA